MGYFTEFSLVVRPGKHNIREIVNAFELELNDSASIELPGPDEVIEHYRVTNKDTSSIARFFTEIGDFYFSSLGERKWYDHEHDMINFSKQFPDAFFVLHGEGEEEGDIWDEQYHNGEVKYRTYYTIVEPNFWTE